MALTELDTKKILNLVSKDEITAVIYRLARGLDRRDKELLASCFHPDATDDHGLFVGTAPDFCDWVIEQLGNYERTQHLIANINIVVDGDKASTEAYFFAHHVVPGDTKLDVIAAGRYLDHFERRGGEWKIKHRKAVYDWSRAEDCKDAWTKPPISEILLRGVQGKEDISYQWVGGLIS